MKVAAMQSPRPPNLTGPRVPTAAPATANSRVPAKKRKGCRSVSPTSRVPVDLRKDNEEKLPPDIIYDILTRLPVKPLSRFRCVSKPWNSLISNPSFQTQHHRRRSQQTPLLLVSQNELDANGFVHVLHFSTFSAVDGALASTFSKTVPESNRCALRLRMIKSCRGLVCLQDDKLILLCNPSTHELIALPPPPSEGIISNTAFGYADITRQFKVVRFSLHDVRDFQSQVFTFGGNSQGWGEARSAPFLPRMGSPLLHGALHLLPSEIHPVKDTDCIATFDINTEEYRGAIPLPEIYYHEGRKTPVFFSELSGSLCLTFDLLLTKQIAEVWILTDYGRGKWAKHYNINLSLADPALRVFTLPLEILSDVNLLVKLDTYFVSKLWWCDSEEICFGGMLRRPNHKIDSISRATTYVESLLSLGSLAINATDVEPSLHTPSLG